MRITEFIIISIVYISIVNYYCYSYLQLLLLYTHF